MKTLARIICLKGAGRLGGGLVIRLCLFKQWKRALFSEPPPPLCLFSCSHACLKTREEDGTSCKLAGWFPSLGLDRGCCGSSACLKHRVCSHSGWVKMAASDSKRSSQCFYSHGLPKCLLHGRFSSSNCRTAQFKLETQQRWCTFLSFCRISFQHLLNFLGHVWLLLRLETGQTGASFICW